MTFLPKLPIQPDASHLFASICPVDLLITYLPCFFCYELFMQLKELLLVERLRECWTTKGQCQELCALGLEIYSRVQWSGVRM